MKPKTPKPTTVLPPRPLLPAQLAAVTGGVASSVEKKAADTAGDIAAKLAG